MKLETLRDFILADIAGHGPIPFSRYMELCLYGARVGDLLIPGYYSRTQEQFGKVGDFYTSSDVHAVFGRLLARQFEQIWRLLGSPPHLDLVELGPGRGLFAQDVLDWAEKKFPAFFAAVHYCLIESSPGLRARLQERFAAPVAAGRVFIHATVEAGAPRHDFLIFANEFFDAFPVEVVAPEGELRLEARDGRLREIFVPPSATVLDYLDRYSVHPETGERVEAGLAAQDYLRRVASVLPPAARGLMLVIDYGYTREEQLAGRHRGTLKAFRRHTLSANPYEAPGEQDLTADVNFTAVAATAQSVRLEPLGLVTQAEFLMGIGEANQFADAFEDCRLPQERAKVALQLKHLATPAGMGESFHALVLGKGVSREAAARLSGLTFNRAVWL